MVELTEDTRGRRLLAAALGFSLLRPRPALPELSLLHSWLDGWAGSASLRSAWPAKAMTSSSLAYADQGWRANVYPAGLAHSIGTGTGWDATPWRAVQRAAWQALTTGPASVLPMELHVGDRFTDAAAEWQVASRPHTTVGGKTVHVRVQKVGEPHVTEERSWGAHERIAVRRV